MNLTKEKLAEETLRSENTLEHGSLDLENKNIEIIESDAFCELPFIHTIYLGSNSLTTIDSKVFECLCLKRLLLNSNKTTVLNSNFSEYLPNLISLDLSDNRLIFLDMDYLKMFDSLRSLNLSSNELFSVDYNLFYSLQKLTCLSLMNNKISEIDPRTISCLTELHELDLSMNQLEIFDFSMFAELSKLKILKLNNNRLKQLDYGLANLKALEELEVCIFYAIIK